MAQNGGRSQARTADLPLVRSPRRCDWLIVFGGHCYLNIKLTYNSPPLPQNCPTKYLLATLMRYERASFTTLQTLFALADHLGNGVGQICKRDLEFYLGVFVLVLSNINLTAGGRNGLSAVIEERGLLCGGDGA